MHKYIFLFLICFSLIGKADTPPQPQTAILNEYPKIDTEGLVWNKWDTENFIILSLDKAQGNKIYKNIERIKEEFFFKWGLENLNFRSKCKVVCVPNSNLLNGLFKIEKTHSELEKDKEGNIKSCSIWLNLENQDDLEKEIAKISALHLNLNWWTKRGMVLLSQNFDDIKDCIDNNPTSLSILNSIDENKWKEQTEIEKKKFDNNSMLMCLFLRKEFGQNIFKNFVRSDQSEKEISKIIGFKNIQDLDGTFKRYSESIYKDKEENKIPNFYLDIKGVKK